jgi:hypothetical protein
MKDASDPFADAYAASRQEAELGEARHMNPLDAAYEKAEVLAVALVAILDACLAPGVGTFGATTIRSEKIEDRDAPTVSVTATSSGPVKLTITTDVIALPNPPLGEPILAPQALKLEMRDEQDRAAEREIEWATDVTGSVTLTPELLAEVIKEMLGALR